MSEEESEESGFYHLTRSGWVRQDTLPYPGERVETWSYQAVHVSDDAKDQIWLTRVWKDTHIDSGDRKALRVRFGIPIAAEPKRHITVQCEV